MTKTWHETELKEIEKKLAFNLISKDEYEKKLSNLRCDYQDKQDEYAQEFEEPCHGGDFDSEPDYREL